MSSLSVGSADTTLAADRSALARRERLFFSGMAIALTVVAFVGFAPTYYLKAHFGTPALSPLLHWHGALFTAWMLLLVAQTSLVAAGRTSVHRKLGVLGVVLAVAMVVIGAAVAITRAQQGVLGPPGAPSVVFLVVPIVGIVVFPILFGIAIYFRRRPDIHKRLVLIGTTELVTAAVGRLPGVVAFGIPAIFALTDLFVLAIAVYDYRTRGRIHPATLWGGLFLIASQPLRLFIGGTAVWQSFATWLIS